MAGQGNGPDYRRQLSRPQDLACSLCAEAGVGPRAVALPAGERERDRLASGGDGDVDLLRLRGSPEPRLSFAFPYPPTVHFDGECDHLQGVVFGYIRTGQRGYLDRARGWADYWRTYFVYRSNEWVYGKEGSWKTSKWGGKKGGNSRGCTEGCHNYGAGLFNYALITGNIDALEGAFDVAEFANMSWTGTAR